MRWLAVVVMSVALLFGVASPASAAFLDVPSSAFDGANLSAQQKADVANVIAYTKRRSQRDIRLSTIDRLESVGELSAWQAKKARALASRGALSVAVLSDGGVMSVAKARVVKRAVRQASLDSDAAAYAAGLVSAVNSGLLQFWQADVMFQNLTGRSLVPAS